MSLEGDNSATLYFKLPTSRHVIGRRDALWAIRGRGHVPLPLFEAADRSRRSGDNRASIDLAGEPQVLLQG
jgi:hypothetical protein